jgi:hypothetical protein
MAVLGLVLYVVCLKLFAARDDLIAARQTIAAHLRCVLG